MRQNLSSLGLGHLRPLEALTSPGRGDKDKPPFRRVHGRHSAGSSRVGMRPNTLMDMRTELKAVPHAGPRVPLPKSTSRKPSNPGGLKKERRPKAQGRDRRSGRSDGVPCVTAANFKKIVAGTFPRRPSGISQHDGRVFVGQCLKCSLPPC